MPQTYIYISDALMAEFFNLSLSFFLQNYPVFDPIILHSARRYFCHIIAGMDNEKSIIVAQEKEPEGEPMEVSLNYRVPGYPRLAEEMGQLPPLGKFRRFRALNARNLLYM